MKRIKLWWIFLLLAVLSVVVRFVPYTMHIDETFKGIEWRVSDHEHVKRVDIRVKGKYKYYLFKDNVFDGEIKIGDYGIFNSPNVTFTGNEAFLLDETRSPKAYLSCRADFKEVLIRIVEGEKNRYGSWYPHKGLVISAPADNRSDAVDIARRIKFKIERLRNIRWLEDFD